jgi:aconitate hydratase
VRFPEGATATDLVLRVTEMLRKHGVVDKFVEYYGAGLSNLTLPDKATLANMSPEYGATIGFFPVDEQALRYLRGTGRPELVKRVERDQQGARALPHRRDPRSRVHLQARARPLDRRAEPGGPRRPQDRIRLVDMRKQFEKDLPTLVPAGKRPPSREKAEGEGKPRTGESWAGEGGSEAVEAATQAPPIMVDVERRRVRDQRRHRRHRGDHELHQHLEPVGDGGRGLLAKKAVEKGLDVKPWVKTSMAPGSQVVTDYLTQSGLLPYLEQLRFNVVGYGCTTCIGNSGPLSESIHRAMEENHLVVAAVLSGNRNFEARIHPLVEPTTSPRRCSWWRTRWQGVRTSTSTTSRSAAERTESPSSSPTSGRHRRRCATPYRARSKPEMFTRRYAVVNTGDENWQALPIPEEGSLYEWDEQSTYVRRPPFFEGMSLDVPDPTDIPVPRVMAVLGQSVTTDHISPAGAIPKGEPAALYLREHGVEVKDFNTFGSRRGNHEVMMRGTFGNVRIKNLLLDGKEGGYTIHFPTGEVLPIYDACMRYQAEGTPLIVLAGQEYGTGSSRDWAAKGTVLLGVRAVIAESFERIHRSNLVGMGVLPLEFPAGETPSSLGLTGRETFDITGVASGLKPGGTVEVTATAEDVIETRFQAKVRLDSAIDVEYYLNGGILQTVLRKMARGEM